MRLGAALLHVRARGTHPLVLRGRQVAHTVARLVHSDAACMAVDELVRVIVHLTAAHGAPVAAPLDVHGREVAGHHALPRLSLVGFALDRLHGGRAGGGRGEDVRRPRPLLAADAALPRAAGEPTLHVQPLADL